MTLAGSGQYGFGYRKGTKYALAVVAEKLTQAKVDQRIWNAFLDAKLEVQTGLVEKSEAEDEWDGN